MSKGPDLSAFPIPRKGAAQPIAINEAAEAAAVEEQAVSKEMSAPESHSQLQTGFDSASAAQPKVLDRVKKQPGRTPEAILSVPASTGQTVATTVKLTENRYLRLADAGKPGPGRLKRRTIQEMIIEALDEWFDRREL